LYIKKYAKDYSTDEYWQMLAKPALIVQFGRFNVKNASKTAKMLLQR